MQILGQKCPKKLAFFFFFLAFLDISARSSRIPKVFGPAYALLGHGQCFHFSSPNLQWLTSFDFQNL